MPTLRSSHKRAPSSSSSTVLSCIITGALCFYAGTIWGMHVGNGGGIVGRDCGENNVVSSTKAAATDNKNSPPLSSWPDSVSRVVSGVSLIDRQDFITTFDVGVPYDADHANNQAVVVLHNSKMSLPPNMNKTYKSALEATQNCDFLNIILTQADNRRNQCVALLGQYESFHIQKFMRLPPDGGGGVSKNYPLAYVNRGSQHNGRKSTKPPSLEQTQQYWKLLQSYLGNLDAALERLQPIATRIAETHHNTIVVMVCNMGQSELLLNFACGIRARQLDLSSILVFATDEETKDLAETIGMTVFYDSSIFGSMPKNAARRYADKNFMQMMMSKVFVVQMTMMLGVNVLFQDVDVVWYKDPLQYFHSSQLSGDFDIYFQDDGNHALYYAPYSANTGFYYVRNNVRTQYFFNSFLLSGDLILSTRSHQIALIAILNEHASMYGLKVKILSRDATDFPGGYHYHRRPGYMKELLQGNHPESYMFHMSWTLNKENKIKFFQQMGEFYLQDACIGRTADRIIAKSSGGKSLFDTCCSAEPLLKCHFRDKPSKERCNKSPPLDNGKPSFW